MKSCLLPSDVHGQQEGQIQVLVGSLLGMRDPIDVEGKGSAREVGAFLTQENISSPSPQEIFSSTVP